MWEQVAFSAIISICAYFWFKASSKQPLSCKMKASVESEDGLEEDTWEREAPHISHPPAAPPHISGQNQTSSDPASLLFLHC